MRKVSFTQMDLGGRALFLPRHTTPARIVETHFPIVSLYGVYQALRNEGLVGVKYFGKWVIEEGDYARWRDKGFPRYPDERWDYQTCSYVRG